VILAFVGQKGGCGKTTAALAVAAELHARGRKVLLVDADAQGSCRTWAEVAAEVGHQAPTVVGMGADLDKPHQLPTLARTYDATVIDCPPRGLAVQTAALRVADLAVVPCGPSAVDAWALGETLELVQAALNTRPELKAAVLITRKVARTAIGKGAREALASSGLPILAAELGYRVAFQEAPAAGLGPAQYAPNDPTAQEVRALTDELVHLAEQTRKGKRHA